MQHTYTGKFRSLDVQVLVDAILLTRTQREVEAACQKIAGFLGTTEFLYGLIWPESFHSVNTAFISSYSISWKQEYVEKSYHLIDPRIHDCLQSLTPILWSTDQDYLSGLAREPLAMMQSARRNHLGAGVLAPVRCCDGAVGVFGVGFSSDEYTPSRQSHLERVAPYVSYLGAYIQQVMVEQSGLGESNRKASLTEREKACLSWAADGHTASEIATKLFVETCTVKFHLRNVIRKMGAKNTTQALALAIVKGYIKPSHGNG